MTRNSPHAEIMKVRFPIRLTKLGDLHACVKPVIILVKTFHFHPTPRTDHVEFYLCLLYNLYMFIVLLRRFKIIARHIYIYNILIDQSHSAVNALYAKGQKLPPASFGSAAPTFCGIRNGGKNPVNTDRPKSQMLKRAKKKTTNRRNCSIKYSTRMTAKLQQ